ncbi:MAG: hypothetical protein ACFCVK_21730 [Acidimicrobiales bacterium]
MRYTPATGYALMAVAVACFLLGAPPWMFLVTGLAALAVGVVGMRQVKRPAVVDGEGDDHDNSGT